MKDVFDEVKSLQEQVKLVLELKKGMKIPVGLIVLLKSTFKCTICLSTVKPPPIFARCCKNLLGCEACVNDLYQDGMTKKCPICRAERAYSETCRMNGFDDFLNGISTLVEEANEDSDLDSSDPFTFRVR